MVTGLKVPVWLICKIREISNTPNCELFLSYFAELRQRELEKEERMRKQEMTLRHLEEARRKEEAMYREREEQMSQMMSRREESMRQRAQANHVFLQVIYFKLILLILEPFFFFYLNV